MILGLGSDIIQIPRIEKAIKRFGSKFLNKIFTAYEIAQTEKFSCQKKIYAHYAKRFAAKEAYVKALGIGFTSNILFTDIEVRNNQLNKPYLQLSNRAKEVLDALKPDSKLHCHLSLSDDYPTALAVVIISTD